MKSSRRLVLSVLITSSALTAQLPDWVTLPSPSPTMLWAESSVVVVQDAAGYHVYSSYTRSWSHLQVSPSAAFHGYDDHVVVVDGNRAFGFATRSARWAALTLNASPLVPSPSSGPVWITALVDGLDVHFFSGLLGAWSSTRFTTTPLGAVSRMAAVFSDGTRTVGYSAHFGVPVDLGRPTSGGLDAVGSCAMARAPDGLQVFSAYRNRWRSVPASPAAAVVKPPSRAGYVVVQEPDRLTFYSAMTDRQTLLYHGTHPVTLTTQANVAAVQDGRTLFAYSCTTGSLDAVTTPTGWNAVHVEQEVVVAEDGVDVHAFGLLEGRFAPPRAGQLLGTEAGTALLIEVASGDHLAFSCLTNSWSRAPAGTYPTHFLTYNGAVLVRADGTLQGFSANRGTWTTRAAPPADSYYQHKAAFCARAGTRLDAFNGRTGEWATVTTRAPATVTCFDMSVMALDGQEMHCFSCYRDGWSSTPCTATTSQLRDECAFGHDGQLIHVWSGSNQVTEWANLPEYWRIAARGGRLHYDLAAEPGAQAVLLLGARRTRLQTPWGELLVDPASAALLPLSISQHGSASRSLPVPDQLSLRGVTVHAQALFIPPAPGAPYLSGRYESTIL